MGLFVCSLLFYRSYENRQVLERWSVSFFLIIAFCWTLFLLSLRWVLRRGRALDKPERPRLTDLISFDFAILFWGMAYLIEAASNSSNAARVTALNFFGSSHPAGVVLDWMSLVCLFVACARFVFPRLAEQWKKAYLLIATMIVVGLAGEGFVRFRAVIAPFPQGFPTYTSEMWANYYVRRNKEGFRDTEHSSQRERDIKRILIVGDSFALGWGLNNIEDRLGEQLAAQLSAATHTKWEMINASEGDTHTLDHIEFLKRSLIFQPDIVILLYVFNDIDYLHAVTPRDAALSSLGVRSILFRNSFFFQELYLLTRLAKLRFQSSRQNQFAGYGDGRAVSQHLRDLTEFVNLASRVSATVRVVHFDFNMVQHPDLRPIYDNFIRQSLAVGIPTWTLNEVFEKYTNTVLRVNRYDGHPNAFANRIAAKRVAELILSDSGAHFSQNSQSVVSRFRW